METDPLGGRRFDLKMKSAAHRCLPCLQCALFPRSTLPCNLGALNPRASGGECVAGEFSRIW
eukprot:5263633-Pyramimonas_sp.AAC.1